MDKYIEIRQFFHSGKCQKNGKMGAYQYYTVRKELFS